MNEINDNNRIHVGILTFHYAINPGSVLQALGLLRTIQSLCPRIDCRIINYQGTNYRKYFTTFNSKWSFLRNVKQCYFIFAYNRYQKFWHRSNNSVFPKKRIDEEELLNLTGYDVIVAGSDQIWNLKLTKKNYLFFVPFCKGVKKISYAASIGMKDFPEEEKEKVADYLKEFQFISVREPEAQNAIEKLIGIRPELMIDPSFLLKKDEYEIIAKPPQINNRYIFLYLRHKNSEVVPYARKMAEAKGLQIVECHDGVRKIFNEDKIVIQPGPGEWLGWLLNATYVFTDSFHGCAFCINCNKQFFVKISSANSEMSSRIYHILDRYGMKTRLIEDEKKMLTMPDIDFSKSNTLLIQDREKALDYLRKALEIL